MFFIITDLTGTFYETIVNCSQKQFVANLFTLFVFNAIFCLADFSSDPFDFRFQRPDKDVPWGH